MFKNLIITTVLGALAIVLGAFGAHALKESLSATELLSFETAVRYQMYHVIVLLFVNTYNGFSISQKNKISLFFFLGILFFSGSIYAINLTSITAKSIWFVTPLGGLFFIIGWILMITLFVKKISNK
ncbi:DUF423 domain-containing protein [Polaribacter sp. KT 15]|uniref:DUF423 domain-containing protein n=1 Tax=Polaribacter sp. KT 15 TaxID=1896175 RepID=UPI00090BC435|nr:DUF423 domain-containing protein [Polaribacter sp. KT 15]SHM99435.1 Uncharacterized membrane protein YgdD, TMEM256/DUF423 family [Polaribacter sp. KT 15]